MKAYCFAKLPNWNCGWGGDASYCVQYCDIYSVVYSGVK
jgi:hypothetical protein